MEQVLNITQEQVFAVLGRLYLANKIQEGQIAQAQAQAAAAQQHAQELVGVSEQRDAHIAALAARVQELEATDNRPRKKPATTK